ncbi:U-box domain-containing protein 35-like [Vicia villosa]|uniref:U-box domain-containing protein 35-like n=1 Tax=Vicia villosa TaxID=3911 RepID=UPI00273B3473|nr:U-box domain-containing protein 35-like [Vicia villosa]XP_058727782.1 U-box domain-containing protein 35-like [Vicia villosa]
MSRVCLHCYVDASDEDNTSCGCGLIGFKKNQVFDFDYSFSSEIEEEDDLFEINLKKGEPLDSIKEEEDYERSTVFSLDIHKDKLSDSDVVYVAVGENGSSMEALSWTLKHLVKPNSTIVSLVHVFPRVKQIPTPMGKIPRSRVNQEYVNIYMTQEKSKRKLLLQKFIDMCTDSKVKVEILLIEGDKVAKAIVELVKNLNILKLVIGTTQSYLRKHASRRQNSTAEMVLKSVEENCDVKIICEGREVIDEMINGCSSQHDEVDGFVPVKRFVPNAFGIFRFRHSS